MKKRTLLAKVLKCVGIPVVVIYLLFSAFLLQSVKQSVTSLTTEDLASKSQVASCQVNNYLTKYQGIAQQLMLNSEVQNFLKSTSSKQKIQETPGFKDVDQTLRNISAADRSCFAATAKLQFSQGWYHWASLSNTRNSKAPESAGQPVPTANCFKN